MSLGHQRWIGIEFPLKEFPKEPRLQLEAALIRHAVPKDGMLELGVLVLFILEEKTPTGIRAEPMCASELNDEIFLLNDALIEAHEHHGIDYDRAELLYEIESQVGASVPGGPPGGPDSPGAS